MREILFKKVLIKSIALLFSVLVWGQPALGCDDWRWDGTCDLTPEIEKVYGNFDNVVIPILFKGASTPLSVVSLHLDPHRAYHDPAEPDGSQSLLRLRSVPER
jgi:hypothetical protein